MELLRKTMTDPKTHRHDNADKKLLFAKEHCPNTTAFHRKQWSFIEDAAIRKNIAYQMQYLEFLIYLYNDYQIYLMLESLLCKDVIVTISGVVEAALLDLVQSARKKAGMPMERRFCAGIFRERAARPSVREKACRPSSVMRKVCMPETEAWPRSFIMWSLRTTELCSTTW